MKLVRFALAYAIGAVCLAARRANHQAVIAALDPWILNQLNGRAPNRVRLVRIVRRVGFRFRDHLVECVRAQVYHWRSFRLLERLSAYQRLKRLF